MYAEQCAKVDQMVRSQVLEGHAQESGDEVGPGRATGKDHSMEQARPTGSTCGTVEISVVLIVISIAKENIMMIVLREGFKNGR